MSLQVPHAVSMQHGTVQLVPVLPVTVLSTEFVNSVPPEHLSMELNAQPRPMVLAGQIR